MYAGIKKRFYSPHMASKIATTIKTCAPFKNNILHLLKMANYMRAFLAREPLVSIGVDILGPLPKLNSRRIILLVITGCFLS